MNHKLSEILEQLEGLHDANRIDPKVWKFIQERVVANLSVEPVVAASPGYDIFATTPVESQGISAGDRSPTAMTVALQPGSASKKQPLNTIPESQLSPGDVVASRYHVLHPLGVGGMGVVYLVHDAERRRPIALKHLHPHQDAHKLEDRLRRELDLNETLTHANIVRTYSLVRDLERNRLCMTMEFVPGETLATLLENQTQGTSLTSIEQLLLWLIDVAKALDWAHQKGVVHCDLKPDNIIISPPSAKVMDFGIAVADSPDGAKPTGGTAYYMAPEQLQRNEVSPASDLYSLSILSFQLLTGYLPQPGMSGPSAMNPCLPKAVDLVFACAMDWMPERRPSSVLDWVHDLKDTFSQTSEPSRSRYRSSKKPTEPNSEVQTSQPATTADCSIDPVGTSQAQPTLSTSDSPEQPRLVWSRVKARIDAKRPEWLEGDERPAPSWVERDDWVQHSGIVSCIPKQALSDAPVPSRFLLSRKGNALTELVWVPEGPAVLGIDSGSTDVSAHETPQIETDVPGFWIARTPITNRMWSIFVEESGYKPSHRQTRSYYLRHWGKTTQRVDSSLWDKPVVWLSWLEVWAFCDFYGVALPTEQQWEKAARGEGGSLYPWGSEEPTAEFCNCQGWQGGVVDVGSTPSGVSHFHLLDCAGNVFEWCADKWSTQTWTSRVALSQTMPRHERERVTVRGGHYNVPAALMRTTYRQAAGLLQGNAHTSFRPVVDAPR